MTKWRNFSARLSATLWTAAALLFLSGCGDSGAPESASAPSPYAGDPVAERMHDADYVAKLERQQAAQRQLIGALADARQALATAQAAAEPDAAAIAALKAKVEEGEKAFEANRQQTMSIIRERMRQQKGEAL